MMEPDKIDLIKDVLEAQKDTDRAFKKLERALGVSLEHWSICGTVSTALDLAATATSIAVGDKWQWIHWYIASGYGKKPIVAKGREIVTVDDLIWLIDECGKQQPE